MILKSERNHIVWWCSARKVSHLFCMQTLQWILKEYKLYRKHVFGAVSVGGISSVTASCTVIKSESASQPAADSLPLMAARAMEGEAIKRIHRGLWSTKCLSRPTRNPTAQRHPLVNYNCFLLSFGLISSPMAGDADTQRDCCCDAMLLLLFVRVLLLLLRPGHVTCMIRVVPISA